MSAGAPAGEPVGRSEGTVLGGSVGATGPVGAPGAKGATGGIGAIGGRPFVA
ncbi:hypothetical protein [Streptomyces heilongjiangensis]|uniref:Collagen-like protein n=1 Tax=Streptomyces heilongjiangensis TaxID=945052 RepID=A0ABW1BI28_9ACTN|nr:hypothetical protein [Streptomyces heilongjiangensis]MDC2950501.1 hypothetical protein [Streptomyces heilongjiangensis]